MTTENFLLKTSEAGIDFIKKHEGLRLQAYRCSAFVPTIGYGHTQGVKMGTRITEEQADIFLKEDLEKVEEQVLDTVSVMLTQNQFDALVSFVFNLGINRLKKSTLLKKLNAGDYGGAAWEFNKWVFAGKIKLNGLVGRRLAESKMFNGVA
jgi:lysozyme